MTIALPVRKDTSYAPGCYRVLEADGDELCRTVWEFKADAIVQALNAKLHLKWDDPANDPTGLGMVEKDNP